MQTNAQNDDTKLTEAKQERLNTQPFLFLCPEHDIKTVHVPECEGI